MIQKISNKVNKIPLDFSSIHISNRFDVTLSTPFYSKELSLLTFSIKWSSCTTCEFPVWLLLKELPYLLWDIFVLIPKKLKDL